MFSRLISSTLRPTFSQTFANQNQKRSFRFAYASLASTTDKGSATSLLSGVQISVTPGVHIIPKRAPGPYAIFVGEKVREFLKAKPETKITEAWKQAAAKWRGLTDNDRRKYAEESVRIQQQYDDAFMRMPAEDFKKMVLDEMKKLQAKRVTALRRQQRQLKEEHDFPEADMAIFKFAALGKDHESELQQLSVPERGTKLGEIWRNLPASEKQAYEKREKAARSKYRRDVESWKKGMEKQGLKRVVDLIKLRTHKEITGTTVSGGRRRRRVKVLASKVATRKRTTKTATGGKAATAKRGGKKAAKAEE